MSGTSFSNCKEIHCPWRNRYVVFILCFRTPFLFWFNGAIWFNLILLFCHRMPCPPTWRSSGTRSTKTACVMLRLLQSETRFLISFFSSTQAQVTHLKWDMFLNSILLGSLLPHNGFLAVWATSRLTTSLEEHQTEGRRSKTLLNNLQLVNPDIDLNVTQAV